MEDVVAKMRRRIKTAEKDVAAGRTTNWRKVRDDVAEVRPEVAREAMRELAAYRKTGKAADWKDVKRRLGL